MTGGACGVPLGERARELALDAGHALTVGDRLAGVLEHEVGVEAAAVGSRRDARVLDAEALLVEGRGRARKAVAAAVRVHQHDGRAAAARVFGDRDERARVAGSRARDARRVPGDLGGGVAQEVRVGERGPDALAVRRGDARGRELLARERLRLGDELVAVERRLEPAPQRLLDAFVQLVEQRRLPAVPELRVGPAHVGDGQHVEVIEPRLVADRAREGIHDLRVGDVLLLRGDRQLQVMAHQPGDQPRVVARQALLEAERLRVHGAEVGMVAAAALGDVVEDRGEVGELRLRQRAEDLRELRELVVVALEREPAQVADDEQRVRVDGVGVEQVVLHAADDAAESRDVAAEHAVEVHAPELVRDAGGRAQDLEEQAMVARVLAELLVDQPQARGDEADGARAHAKQARVLLQHEEQLEQRRRMAREDVVGNGLEALVALLEMPAERAARGRRGRRRSPRGTAAAAAR